ncbi:hypothetical protein IW492_09750 [Enterococcus sp. BWB1-3]|uniref:hypothetical protein n=1 Tax=unclassified Enterococcus TaxID=2608891 RepID=UPI001923F71D|nr:MULTISPECIES: hypothetical protein [unclassified Enterococcus]MBL1229515.1 hypothetical protein [Enterococcus sp. BWB1-3]MCB5950794.1 hypothetical protein [Enterococcus sp. BWT-B8]MCB5955235.1 hypothetical protein [Enterococcus sp. CWB-B31]
MEEFNVILKQFEYLNMDNPKEWMNSSLTPSLLKTIQSLEKQIGFSIYYISHTNQPVLTTKGRIFLQVMASAAKKNNPASLSFSFDQQEDPME